MEFLESSGIVLNVKRKTWFFDDQPKRQFHFVEQIQESCDAIKLNVSKTATSLTVKEIDHPDFSHADEVNRLTSIQQLEPKDHPDQLREDEELIGSRLIKRWPSSISKVCLFGTLSSTLAMSLKVRRGHLPGFLAKLVPNFEFDLQKPGSFLEACLSDVLYWGGKQS
ncbi:hypothetical protein NPIL_565481 [Nephila pilipes]|uniref:Uncharacterized protein n=1 Tax=Nephila pilipes TaxID=299642 RepID=A0A8X6NLD3_NEPPI|nr:hypothetical protein NPIL_565481 [Nephila pilipes]